MGDARSPASVWWRRVRRSRIGERALVKKGRHRRFEEARKLKQSGPDEFVFSDFVEEPEPEDEDEYAALARKYGAFDEDEDGSADNDGSEE
jgi:hypothetical protein